MLDVVNFDEIVPYHLNTIYKFLIRLMLQKSFLVIIKGLLFIFEKSAYV